MGRGSSAVAEFQASHTATLHSEVVRRISPMRATAKRTPVSWNGSAAGASPA